MMTQTFAERNMERRELLRGIMRSISQEERKRGDRGLTFRFKLERAISEYLQQRAHNAPRHNISEETSLFIHVILEPINRFSRSQEEDDALVAEIHLRVVRSTTMRFQGQRIVHGPEPALFAVAYQE